jgi:hypothetical protein
MRAPGWVLGFVCLIGLAAVATAEPTPQAVDIKGFRDQLLVFEDAEGGIYAVKKAPSARVFYGTRKALYEQVTQGGSRNGDAWSISVWAPRLAYPFLAMVARKQDGTFEKTCQGKNDHGLAPVTGEAAKAILAKAKFLTTPIIRRPHLLARNDSGVYYYVDVLAKLYGGKGYRVFVGKKGAMKQVPLTDVTVDTGGEVFSTKTGDLRLVRIVSDGATAKSTAVWIRGGKRHELISLDVYMNYPVIYRDLGIYKITGALCGNI